MEFKNDINSNSIESTKRGYIDCNNVYIDSDSIGKNDDRSNTFQNTSTDIDYDEENVERNNDTNVNIYRYKFTNDFTDELFKFSKVHQYDHRKDFKAAWETWMEENSRIINEEVRRLSELGYEGDIIDKMFKSARYYFRKKSTEKKEPVKRRVYVGSHKELLEKMDEHIKSEINSGEFKPSDGFDEFCKQNIELLKEQINMLVRSGITDSSEIKSKIKKTYKNRYFLIISK